MPVLIIFPVVKCEQNVEVLFYKLKMCRYRNKCEFTVGLSEENKLPTVGFRIGSYVNGITGVGPVDELPHIPDAMKFVVKVKLLCLNVLKFSSWDFFVLQQIRNYIVT